MLKDKTNVSTSRGPLRIKECRHSGKQHNTTNKKLLNDELFSKMLVTLNNFELRKIDKYTLVPIFS